MGYRTRLIIGRPADHGSPEYERDMDKPYADGSGYERKTDIHGNEIKTGRTGYWFNVMAVIDLSKTGEGPVGTIGDLSRKKAKEYPNKFYYIYGSDGNTEISVDRYEDKFWPVPVKDVLEALKSERGPYRRFKWAIALLESMQDDPEGIEVLFFGH